MLFHSNYAGVEVLTETAIGKEGKSEQQLEMRVKKRLQKLHFIPIGISAYCTNDI